MQVTEVFFSIQGESSYAGLPCIFIRLTGCNLRCTYCDTTYSFYGGEKRDIADILQQVSKWNCHLVEITGGEPLLQKETPLLCKELVDRGYTVLLETSGAQDISVVDPDVIRIMDLKGPSSGEMERNRMENLAVLTPKDEVKFVIGDRGDYDWARTHLPALSSIGCTVLFSPVFERMQNLDLATWILEDRLNVRFQMQMHKYIWDPQKRGV